MNKLPAMLVLLATALPVALSAAVPLRWTVETSCVKPAQFEAYHGETLELAATMQSCGKPLAITNDLIGIYWQTNGMGSAYWTAPAVLSNNVMIARWTPEMDVGANVYSCFIGTPGEIYRAAFQLRLRPSPGAVPSELPLPVKTLDFAQITVLNAPYYTRGETDAALSGKQDTISDLATIRSGAALGATAVQPAAISDMETKTHAAATYQPKGSYLTSESDPTATEKANAAIAAAGLNYAVKSNAVGKISVVAYDAIGSQKMSYTFDEDGVTGRMSYRDSPSLPWYQSRRAFSIQTGHPCFSGDYTVGMTTDNALFAVAETEEDFYNDNFISYYGTDGIGARGNDGEMYEIAHPHKNGVIALVSDIPSIDATDTTFSNAVLAVGLSIDTNSVAQINAILNDLGGVPIEGTATTVGGLLLALAAAVAWLKMHALRKGLTGGVPDDPNVSALFSGANTSLMGVVRYAFNSDGTIKDRAINAITYAGGSLPNFPAQVSGYARDFLLNVTATATASDITLPESGATSVGDALAFEASHTYLVAITEIAAKHYYVRVIDTTPAN